MKPTVTHMNNLTPGWTRNGIYVYVGRSRIIEGVANGGYFGNPHPVGYMCPICHIEHGPGGTLELFEAYARHRIETDPVYKQAVKDLYGKILVCYCSPKPCHGDILAKLAEELNTSMIVNVWTDGACGGAVRAKGSKGELLPGGWAFRAKYKVNDLPRQFSGSGFEPETTNNRMELRAILEALKAMKRVMPYTEIVIHTDSNNAIQWLTKAWNRNDPNISALCDDIWKEIETKQVKISYVHVKGHAGDPENEWVDQAAVKAYKEQI